ncbi:MAG: zinc metallopeptidase [Muribaculaceae bacterium]
MTIFVIFIAISAISYFVQANFQRKFKQYSKMPLQRSMNGTDVAIAMLHAHGIYDVKVQCTQGTLTDHYNPTNKTVNLSEGVARSNSIAAAAVAAHECGHAVQHAQGYAPLKLRSSLVPIVSFASTWVQWILLIGVILVEAFPQILMLGVVLFASSTVFSLVTLPVEINASMRAISWLNNSGITYGNNTGYAKDALRSAAYTYVVAALSSLATLFYYVMVLMSRSRD